MVKIIKYVNLLILFISIFLVVTDVNGKLFPYLFELSCLSYIYTKYFIPFNILFLLFFITAHKRCREDFDCRMRSCVYPTVAVCINRLCRCRRPPTL